MNIFFPKEPEYETRVSLTLESAKKFLDKGLDVSIEKSFAEHLGSSKKDFEDLGRLYIKNSLFLLDFHQMNLEI